MHEYVMIICEWDTDECEWAKKSAADDQYAMHQIAKDRLKPTTSEKWHWLIAHADYFSVELSKYDSDIIGRHFCTVYANLTSPENIMAWRVGFGD